MADIEYWLGRTRVLLCGHDYLHENYPDVQIVVDELLPDAEQVPGTSIWAFWPRSGEAAETVENQ